MTRTREQVLAARAIVPEHVLYQEVVGNSALLNLETETYFGLDDVGTRMWVEISEGTTLGEIAARLVEVYDAPLETIESDLIALTTRLCEKGLLSLAD